MSSLVCGDSSGGVAEIGAALESRSVRARLLGSLKAFVVFYTKRWVEPAWILASFMGQPSSSCLSD